jgi:hypothetical protein
MNKPRFIVTSNTEHSCCHQAAIEDTQRITDTIRIGDELRHEYEAIAEFGTALDAQIAADSLNYAPRLAAALKALLEAMDDGSDEPLLVTARVLIAELPDVLYP